MLDGFDNLKSLSDGGFAIQTLLNMRKATNPYNWTGAEGMQAGELHLFRCFTGKSKNNASELPEKNHKTIQLDLR